MPVYEYKCDACGHYMEVFQKMSATALQRCPKCAADTLRKLISAAAFKLQGTGWYETDFKNNAARKTTQEDDGGKAKQDKTPDKKATSDAATGRESGKTSKETKTTSPT